MGMAKKQKKQQQQKREDIKDDTAEVKRTIRGYYRVYANKSDNLEEMGKF